MQNRSYFGLKLSQRGEGHGVNFFIFVAGAKDVDQWAGTKRVGDHNNGTQRVLKETRVKAIQRFLARNQNNSIPVGVVIAFNPDTTEFADQEAPLVAALGNTIHNEIDGRTKWGTLSFAFDENSAEEDRPALIVDGQHRVRGMASMPNEDVPVLIIALLDAPPQEQAFQFVVINNKVQKVATDNVKAIIRLLEGEENELTERLREAGVNYGRFPATLGDIDQDANSPFQGLLSWPMNRDEQGNDLGFVDLTAIENCIKYLKSQLPILKDDDETVKEVFLACWRAVKSKFPDLWAETKQEFKENAIKNKFMSKVNISALNEFIVDKVGNAWLDDKFDLYVTSKVEAYCSDFVLRQIRREFWEQDWSFKLQDNVIVRNKIKEDIVRITQNIKSEKEWYEGLVMVGAA